MATSLRTLLVAVGFVFSAAVNASPSMLTDELEAQQMVDCTAWYSPQLKTPPETCTDVVNEHPGLDLATFLKLNPAIHPNCDNMLLGQKVCVAGTQQNDSPQPQGTGPQQWESSTPSKPQETGPQQWESSTPSKPQETGPKQQETGSQQWESSPKQWETSAAPKPQETGPKQQETGSQQWESSPKQWETSAAPKQQKPSSTASYGWH